MEPIDLLVDGAAIVCMDEADTIIRDGAIAIAGDRIHWIGTSSEARTRFQPEQTLVARDRIALPGLIDGHFHTAQQLLRGKIVSLGRQRVLKNPIWKNYYIPFEAMLTPEDIYLSGLVAYTNMIGVGTTCFAEAGGPHPDDMARAADEVGIRGFVALSTVDQGAWVPPSMMMTTDEAIERNVRLVRRWRSGRVQAMLALRQILICSTELVRAIGRAAQEEDARIHIHLCEGTYEIDYALEQFGRRPAEYLESLGVFNERLHCAHSILLAPEEMDLFVRRRATACHCATNNYHIGQMRLLEMWRRGVAVGLGTDGAAAWGTLDIFQVAHLARVGQTALFGTTAHHRTLTSGEEMLAIATRGGARALGLADVIGTLAPGRKADIIVCDAQAFDQAPLYDPGFAAANTTVGRDVESVIVDGKLVMKDREMFTVDVERIRALLAARLPALMEKLETVTR